jgi:hypothetical protein
MLSEALARTAETYTRLLRLPALPHMHGYILW